MTKLTIKQKQTMEAIAYFINTNGYPPTTAELSKMLKVSPSAVFKKLMILEEKGYIKTTIGKARSIVVMKGWE
ncbi:MAG: HTH domain-containing protein [Bacilli bacterium]